MIFIIEHANFGFYTGKRGANATHRSNWSRDITRAKQWRDGKSCEIAATWMQADKPSKWDIVEGPLKVVACTLQPVEISLFIGDWKAETEKVG